MLLRLNNSSRPVLDSLFRIRDPWLLNLSRCEQVGTPEGNDCSGNMATGRVCPGPAPACAVVGHQALQLRLEAEVVGPVGAHSYQQSDGVPVGLVPPALVGGGQEQLDGVGAALRKGTVEILCVPALGLRLLPGQVYQQGLQQDTVLVLAIRIGIQRKTDLF